MDPELFFRTIANAVTTLCSWCNLWICAWCQKEVLGNRWKTCFRSWVASRKVASSTLATLSSTASLRAFSKRLGSSSLSLSLCCIYMCVYIYIYIFVSSCGCTYVENVTWDAICMHPVMWRHAPQTWLAGLHSQKKRGTNQPLKLMFQYLHETNSFITCMRQIAGSAQPDILHIICANFLFLE